MDKDNVWGFVWFVILLICGIGYYKLLWWWGWKRSRGQLPMYGQSWASSSGRRLYVLGIKSSGETGSAPLVDFTDVDPTMHEAYSSWSWTMGRWKQEVDQQRLVLDDLPWTAS